MTHLEGERRSPKYQWAQFDSDNQQRIERGLSPDIQAVQGIIVHDTATVPTVKEIIDLNIQLLTAKDIPFFRQQSGQFLHVLGEVAIQQPNDQLHIIVLGIDTAGSQNSFGLTNRYNEAMRTLVTQTNESFDRAGLTKLPPHAPITSLRL